MSTTPLQLISDTDDNTLPVADPAMLLYRRMLVFVMRHQHPPSDFVVASFGVRILDPDHDIICTPCALSLSRRAY